MTVSLLWCGRDEPHSPHTDPASPNPGSPNWCSGRPRTTVKPSTVEDWARREARNVLGVSADYRWGYERGARRLADRLLSDEAVEVAWEASFTHFRHLSNGACECGEQFSLTGEGQVLFQKHVMRAALQAAIEAVTKEDGNE